MGSADQLTLVARLFAPGLPLAPTREQVYAVLRGVVSASSGGASVS